MVAFGQDGQMENKITNPAKEIEPRYLAQQCPVCNGFGTLKYGTKTCQACEGRGYVLVPNFKIEGRIDRGIEGDEN